MVLTRGLYKQSVCADTLQSMGEPLLAAQSYAIQALTGTTPAV